MPFLTEYIYLNLKDQHEQSDSFDSQNFVAKQQNPLLLCDKQNFKESVHLEKWPKINNNLINKSLEEKMEDIKKLISQALAQRKQANIKVRQPLASLQFPISNFQFSKELLDLIKEEVNVKEVIFGKELKLDIEITAELREEGVVREIIRHIQIMRKKTGLTPNDYIIIQLMIKDKKIKEIIKQGEKHLKETTLANKLIFIANNYPLPNCSVIKQFSDQEKKVQIEEETIYLKIQKQ